MNGCNSCFGYLTTLQRNLIIYNTNFLIKKSIIPVQMGKNLQVLFVCNNAEKKVCVTAEDLENRTNLINYKGGGSIQSNSLCILGAEYVFAANNAKPLLHVWPINQENQIATRNIVVPGRVNAMVISPCKNFLIAGIQESLYIWQLRTGRLLNKISKHYQPISCIRFASDSSLFISSSNDGNVLVWNLTMVVTYGDNSHYPVYSFCDHGLPVKDIHVGTGGGRAYMYTVSLDRSCKIYNLSNGILLLTVCFKEALHSVVVDLLETTVYVGTCMGNLYHFYVDSKPRVKEYFKQDDDLKKFAGHKSGTPVNCLKLSLDNLILISGGEDQQVRLWHTGSFQLIHSIPNQGPIINIELRLLNSDIFNPAHKQPKLFADVFRRVIDSPEIAEDVAIETLVRQPIEYSQSKEVIERMKAPVADTNINREATSTLQNEVKHLHSINEILFKKIVGGVFHREEKC